MRRSAWTTGVALAAALSLGVAACGGGGDDGGNGGSNENAKNVVAQVQYDPNLTFVSANPPPNFGTTDTWTIGNLNVGSSGLITITLVKALPATAAFRA